MKDMKNQRNARKKFKKIIETKPILHKQKTTKMSSS